MTGKEVTSPQVSSNGHMIGMADGMAYESQGETKGC
jgi:glutaredoxin